jgi:hypothetical protein
MNSISRAFRRSEFEDPASPWLELFIGVVIVLCAIAIGAVFGFEHRSRIQRVIDAEPKARPTVANPPPPLIPCGDPIKSRELVNQICRARARSAKVGA